MAGLLRATTPADAATPPQRVPWRSEAELMMRAATEAWGRAKWPEARVCHELVMGRGKVRADVAFVSPDHLVAVEIKSPHDGPDRLINQVAMFRLATPEVWIVASAAHLDSADLIRFLLPSVGTATTDPALVWGVPPKEFVIRETAPAQRHEPHPAAMLSLLWVEELYAEADRAGLVQHKTPPRHDKLVKLLLRLDPDERLAAVCRQLRGRDAFWRADPPIREAASRAGRRASVPPRSWNEPSETPPRLASSGGNVEELPLARHSRATGRSTAGSSPAEEPNGGT